MTSRLTTLVCALLVGTAPLLAVQPQFWRIEGARDFLEGELDGLSVDSEGRVRLAPRSRLLHDPESPHVWGLAQDAKGTLYAGTGNEGRIFRISDGKGSLFYDAPELEVHALVVGPDGKLYAGTSPDGKVYAIDATGKAETFYDPSDKYIWALAFDRAGHLLVTTGAEAKVYRVDSKGQAKVLLTSPETHLTALAVSEDGTAYAGSASGGIIYRIDNNLKVFVLYDSPYREIKTLQLGPLGTIYAAAIDGGKDKPEAPPAPPAVPSIPTVTAGMADVIVTESFALLASPAATPSSGRTVETPRPGASKGAVLRIFSSGEVEALWSSAEETPHCLGRVGEALWVGTGNKGKIYRISEDRTWSMEATLPTEQVTGFLSQGPKAGLAVATSNPGKVYMLEASPGTRGTFTSKPKDTDTVSGWGRIRWEATAPPRTEVQVQSRSGNTGAPDSTWSDWSPVYRNGESETVVSERARFLQVRAVLVGKDGGTPVLDSLSTAYLQRNLRPQVTSLTVHPPGEVFQKPLSVTGEIEILGMEPVESAEARLGAPAARLGMPTTTFSRKIFQKGLQTFSWKAEDPNGDTLSYEVHYRRASDTRYRLLRKGLTDAVLAWDTATAPNGRYVVRITASDSASNPASVTLTADKESPPFDIDNTPPEIAVTLLAREPARVRAVVKDENSVIRKTEYAVNGGRWQEVHSTDGISDSLQEAYEFAPSDLSSPGPNVVVVRAMDLLGNVASGRVEIPSP